MWRTVPLTWVLFMWWEKIILIPARIVKSIFIECLIQIISFSQGRLTRIRVLPLRIKRNRWIPLQQIMITFIQNLIVHLLRHLVMPGHPHQIVPGTWASLPVERAEHLGSDAAVTHCEAFEVFGYEGGCIFEEFPHEGWDVDAAI